MARTIDPTRHHARRLHIINAGLTRFAEDGYHGATTAAICQSAGIGSGTFFHYFPTKAALLVAIIEFGTHETHTWFERQSDRDDALGVIKDYVHHAVDEMADPRVGGFVRAVGSVMTQPEIAAALTADEVALRTGLTPWVTQAQQHAEIRSDQSAERLTAWIMLLLDGFLGRLASDPHFTARSERAFLGQTLDRMLSS